MAFLSHSVAGVAALVWSYFPECSNHQIRSVLALTALSMSSSGCDELSGFGLVQAKAAFDLLDKYGCSAGGEDPKPLSSGGIGGCSQPLPDTIAFETNGSQNPTRKPTPQPTLGYFPIDFGHECKTLHFELLTDTHAIETSWVLKQVIDDGGSVEVASGPPKGRNYADETKYSGAVSECLDPGTYNFTISGEWFLCAMLFWCEVHMVAYIPEHALTPIP